MQAFFGFLLFVIIVALVVAMIKPRWVFRREMGRVKAVLILVGAFIVVTLVGSSLDPQDPPVQNETEQAEQVEQTKSKQPVTGDLGITPVEIVDRFNASGANANSPIKARASEPDPNDPNTLLFTIGRNQMLTIPVDPATGLARKAILMTMEGNSKSGMINTTLGQLQLLEALMPEASKAERNQVLFNMDLVDNPNPSSSRTSTEQFKFHFMDTGRMGYWLTVEIAE